MAKNLRLITFRIGPETFAADIMAVRQVVMYEGATTVPDAPPFLEGVIVFRGEVIPVVDLRRRFFPHQSESLEQPLVMITAAKAGPIGLKVDEVRTLASVTTDDLLPAPRSVRGVKSDYLVAIVEHRAGRPAEAGPHTEAGPDTELLLVLDLDAILTDDEQRALHETNLTPG
jgi:purine-binding chemotaxis protein CheW